MTQPRNAFHTTKPMNLKTLSKLSTSVAAFVFAIACGSPTTSGILEQEFPSSGTSPATGTIPAPDTDVTRYCASHHVKEGIAVNEERKDLYAKASQSRSLKVTEQLVQMERNMVSLLPLLELPALFYQSKGIPVLCWDLISMKYTPPFLATTARPTEAYTASTARELAQVLGEFSDRKETDKLEAKVVQQLDQLNRHPSYHCLERHFLESILRSLHLVPVYQKLSQAQGVLPPNAISGLFIRSQIRALNQAAEIDDLAAPLQSEGIPMVCRDVPPIPVDIAD